jgi:hypothetical protein
MLGAILIVLEGLIDAIRGVVFVVVGRTGFAFGAWSQSLVFVLLGIVLFVIVLYGRAARPDGTRAAGIVLVILPLLGFFLFGFLNGILVLLGAVLVLVAGILYPARGGKGCRSHLRGSRGRWSPSGSCSSSRRCR